VILSLLPLWEKVARAARRMRGVDATFSKDAATA